MDKRALLSTSPGTVLKIFLVILIRLLRCLTKLALQSSTQVSSASPIYAAFAVAFRNRPRMNLSRFLKSGQKLSSSWIAGIKRYRIKDLVKVKGFFFLHTTRILANIIPGNGNKS